MTDRAAQRGVVDAVAVVATMRELRRVIEQGATVGQIHDAAAQMAAALPLRDPPGDEPRASRSAQLTLRASSAASGAASLLLMVVEAIKAEWPHLADDVDAIVDRTLFDHSVYAQRLLDGES